MSKPVRVEPPTSTTHFCRDCSSIDGVYPGATACTDCLATDGSAGPVVKYGPSTLLPMSLGGRQPRVCCSCDAVWVTVTSNVIWFFEDGLTGNVCRTCALADEPTRMWQLLCDASDAIDNLMKAAPKDKREMLVDSIAQRAQWFSEWDLDGDA